MLLEQIGNKQAHILHTEKAWGQDGSYVLFSYATPVARYDEVDNTMLILNKEGINGWLRGHMRPELTKTPTTTRHINEFKFWLSDCGLLDSETYIRETSDFEEIQ